MKIFYASDSWFPSESANSVHVMKMCEALAQCGHEVVLSGLQKNKSVSTGRLFEHYGVQQNFIIRVTRSNAIKGILFIHAFRNLVHIMREKPDLVFGRSFLSVALASIFFSKKKIAFETHDPYASMNRIQRWSFNRILKRARLIVVMSGALEKILKNEIGSGIKTLAVHDGATQSEVAISADVKINSSKLNIGYIGTVQKGRGVELVVELSRMLLQYDFHIVGGTSAALLKLLAVNELPGNIHCHGFVPPSVASAYRKRCDILLAPYQNQTLIRSGKDTSGYMSPLKIFEYMSDRKAIIASDLPVLREVLNPQNSVLVRPDDIKEWKEAIVTLSVSENRNKLADRAFLDFQEHYTWKKRAEKILEQV